MFKEINIGEKWKHSCSGCVCKVNNIMKHGMGYRICYVFGDDKVGNVVSRTDFLIDFELVG